MGWLFASTRFRELEKEHDALRALNSQSKFWTGNKIPSMSSLKNRVLISLSFAVMRLRFLKSKTKV